VRVARTARVITANIVTPTIPTANQSPPAPSFSACPSRPPDLPASFDDGFSLIPGRKGLVLSLNLI
jgi:hypothetical protein